MGPPKDGSSSFFFGKMLQSNSRKNDDTHLNSSANEDDVDATTSQNDFRASKLFENPQTADREERSPYILQSTSLPAVLPPTVTKETGSTLLRARILEQDSSPRKEGNETNSLQTAFLEDESPKEIQDDLANKKDNAILSFIRNVVNGSESSNVQSSSKEDKFIDDPEKTNNSASDGNNIPMGFENSVDSKEPSRFNSQSDSTRTNEIHSTPFEIAKKNFQISKAHSKAFDDFLYKKAQKKTLQSSSANSTVERGFATAEKKNLQDSLAQTTEVNEGEKKSFQSSSAESSTKKLPTCPYSNTYTINSSFEEREELCFFDRAKFIAICGEDVYDQSQEPWPQDVKLYQPYEVEQVILPDNANCLAVQAFLKMCGLDFQTEQRHNAEYMSPSGRVPFIKCGAFVVSELDPIIAFINTKGISLTSQLDATQRADMRAYMSLANTVLANAELYVAWVDSTTANAVTRPRYGSVHPWPLNHIVTWQKARQVRKRLAVLGWLQKSLQEVYGEVENCCNALSERLDKKDFFFGSRPTELDALVFGHLFTVLTTPLPSNRLASIVRGYPALVELVKRIEKQFFQRDN